MNGLWMGRYLRRWNRNTLVPRQPLTNDGPSGAIAAAPATPPLLSSTPLQRSLYLLPIVVRVASRTVSPPPETGPPRTMIKQGGKRN